MNRKSAPLIRPNSLFMKSPKPNLSLGAKGGTEEVLALSVLSALSIAGIHSAINPSLFTLMSFASKPEAKARAMKGLWIGLGASTIASVAIYGVFKMMLPAIISEATAIALFASGVWAVHQPPADSIPLIERQDEILTAPQGVQQTASV